MLKEIPPELISSILSCFPRSVSTSIVKSTNLIHDLWFVLLGLRTGTLIDVTTLSIEQARKLALNLNQFSRSSTNNWSIYVKQLKVIHEPISTQTFVINADVLLRKRDEELPRFVEISNREPEITERPDSFKILLTELVALIKFETSDQSRAFSLEEESNWILLDFQTITDRRPKAQIRSIDMIPLAAYLLDYEIAYYFSNQLSDGIEIGSLGQRALTVVKLGLRAKTTKTHDDYLHILSFSLPTSLDSHSNGDEDEDNDDEDEDEKKEQSARSEEAGSSIHQRLKRRLNEIEASSLAKEYQVELEVKKDVIMDRFAL